MCNFFPEIFSYKCVDYSFMDADADADDDPDINDGKLITSPLLCQGESK